MKNLKLTPVNEIGVYQDSDGSIYESKVIAIATWEPDPEENNFLCIRPITEFDLSEGYIDFDEYNGFLKIKK